MVMNQPRLTRIHVAGFRSLGDVTLDLTPVTVLIGPNGAGKSNLLWALEMTRMLAFEALQLFVSERGGATYLLHYGPQVTEAIDLRLEFATDGRENAYEARLGYGSDESLLFRSERAGFRRAADAPWEWYSLGSGHRESRLREEADKHATPRTVRWLLRQLNFYHFHDTSRLSPLRTRTYNDSTDSYLRADGSNLPAYLLTLQSSTDPGDQAAWKRVQGLVHRVAPFIRELSPQVDARGVHLDWVDERGAKFGPAHMSDGTLRALALLTALGQPSSRLPLLSCVDEPELGLHPAALRLLCGIIRSVAAQHQVIVATQSPIVLDAFEPGEVVVTERDGAATVVRRLEEAALGEWLTEYTLSDLYDKNLLGGQP